MLPSHHYDNDDDTVMTKICYGTTSFRELITVKVWRPASGCLPCTTSDVYVSSSRAKTEKVMNAADLRLRFASRHHFIFHTAGIPPQRRPVERSVSLAAVIVLILV